MPRRGEVWWAQLDPTIGSEINKTRPCIVISNNVTNERRRTIVVVPLSSSGQIAPPLTVPIKCAGRKVVAVIDQIRAISKERLKDRIESLPTEQIESVESALREILEL